MEEIEVKFLDINKKDIEERLKDLGAKFVGSYNYRLKPYDFPGLPLSKDKNAWVRLRDEGDKVTLSYKERLGVGENHLKDKGMKEIEVEVSDFEKTSQILESIGLIHKVYEEKKRTRYLIDEVECDIDEWPLTPPYIEIEGESMERIKEVAIKLGFNWEDHVICSASQVMRHHGIDSHDYSVFTFEKQIKK